MRRLRLSIMFSVVFLMAAPNVAKAQAVCSQATQILDAIPSALRDVSYIEGFKITWKGVRYRCRKEPLFGDMEKNMEMMCSILSSMAAEDPFSNPALSAMSGHMGNIMAELSSFSTMTATSQADAEFQVDAKMFAIDSSLTALTAIKPQTQNNQTKRWVKRRSSCRQSGSTAASNSYDPSAQTDQDLEGGAEDTTNDTAQAEADAAAAQANYDGMTNEEKLAAIQDLIAEDAAGGGTVDQDLLDDMAEVQAEIAAEQAAAAAAAAAIP